MISSLINFITGHANSTGVTVGANTPAPYAGATVNGAKDGSGPADATKNMAEIYNRLFFDYLYTLEQAGLPFDPANWAQGTQAIKALAAAGFNALYAPAAGGTDNRGVAFAFDKTKAAMQVGGSDTASTNDERNYWRGLSAGQATNAWGSPVDIGLYSTAWNRNGASKGTYSNTFGHDCVTYGTASIAGGAGSATGNPDDPNNTGYGFNGYCAFAWGKNNLAQGEKSAVLGEENVSKARSGIALGYANKTAELAGDGGIGAVALGREVDVKGSGAAGLGRYIAVTGGGSAIGSGINPSSPMTVVDEVGIGANVQLPTAAALKGSGAAGDYGKWMVRADKQVYLGNTTLTVAQTSQALVNGGSGGYGEYSIKVLAAGVMLDGFKFDAVTSAGIASFLPEQDAVARIGAAGNRINYLFLANAPIVTSDKREKADIKPIDDAVLKAWASVSFVQYKLKSAIKNDGDQVKTNFGVIAQDVIAAFERHGLNALAYGVVHLSKWTDKKGKQHEQYGVDYDQALVLECASLRRMIQSK
jgi:Chaperone of endosialidase